ncbi:MAG TPA: hypothetical protein DCL44_10770 [Elusimicrobia bacterium]|nr:hypothetical protein [Elusimicrobiota bacterium]
MKKTLIAAVLIMMTGGAYAAEFADLAVKATDLKTRAAGEGVPVPAISKGKVTIPVSQERVVGTQADAMTIKGALLKISDYTEKELCGNILNSKELEDLTNHLNFFVGLPAKDIPVGILGYLEGISISIQELLPKGPVGRNIAPALKAARTLQLKTQAILPSNKAGATEKGTAQIQASVLKISDYTEKELAGKLLNTKELEDLTKQLSFLALPGTDIPMELLGYLEGISISIQELLPKGPVGRNIAPALKAARALQVKVVAL